MRIAFVSDAVYPYNKGGKEKRLFELSTRLADMGHDVHIYTMKWWDGPRDRTEVGVHLHAICKLHKMYHGERRSIKQGIFFGVAGFKMLFKKFEIIDVDHMPFFPIFSVWAVCKIRGHKMYATWHEALKLSDWTDYMGVVPGSIAAGIERLSIRLPHTITVNSKHTYELIESELKRTKRLHIVTPGVDIKRINKVRRLPLKCDVLFVGRLVKDKNIDLLVRAIKILSKENPDIKCVIIGSGSEEKNITRSVKKLGLEKNVCLLGHLPSYEEVYTYMKASKVFALPSKREGFGMVVLEALACGIPVVTADLPANGSKSLIKNGVNGSVVKPTALNFANAIDEWILHAPDHSFISRLINEYDWEKLANKQAEVYAT